MREIELAWDEIVEILRDVPGMDRYYLFQLVGMTKVEEPEFQTFLKATPALAKKGKREQEQAYRTHLLEDPARFEAYRQRNQAALEAELGAKPGYVTEQLTRDFGRYFQP